jgi:HEAT repeat protein
VRTIQITILTMLALNVVLAASVVVVRLTVARRRAARDAVRIRWGPRVRQLLAGETSAATLQPLIRRGDRRHLAELLAEYGLRVGGVELERLRTLGPALLGEARKGLRSRMPETRARAVQTVGILGGRTTSSLLAELLDDESPLVALVAAKWLCSTPDCGYAAEVVTHLNRFELWNPVFLASMLSAGGSTMADHLRTALESSETPERTRALAADALRLIRDPAAADAAAAVLRSDAEREVLAACLRLLSGLGTSVHAGAVRRFVEGGDFVLRALAITALGALSDGEGDIRLLDAALDDQSSWVALHAARALRTADRLDVLERVVGTRRRGAAVAGEVLAGGTA